MVPLVVESAKKFAIFLDSLWVFKKATVNHSQFSMRKHDKMTKFFGLHDRSEVREAESQ